jgi:hypothetical protein
MLSIGLDNSLHEPRRAMALKAAEAAYVAGDVDGALKQIAAFRQSLHPSVQDRRAAQADTLEMLANDLGPRRQRDAALALLTQALAAGKSDEAAAQAKAFLANVTKYVDDPRTTAVRELLAIAEDREPQRLRDAALAEMQVGLTSGDVEQVLESGGRFLNHLTEPLPDPRTTAVRRELEMAIMRGLTAGSDRLDEKIAVAANLLNR